MSRRVSLRDNLDQEVYQIIRKYQDERGEGVELKAYTIYDYIQRSNSSLKRKQRTLLETSIRRVISFLAQDKQSNPDPDQDAELNQDAQPDSQIRQESENSNMMNQLIVSSWNISQKKSDQPSSTINDRPNGEHKHKKRRRQIPDSTTKSAEYTSLDGIGGLGPVLDQFEEHLVLPLLLPRLFTSEKAPYTRGILLYGPPGCGKTMLSKAFAAELGISLIEILGPSVVSGMSGESEQKIRECFAEAKRQAPSILFIDEIDVLAPKREHSQTAMDKRMVAQLLISMDSLEAGPDQQPVIVIAATNRPDALDPALRRGGRFDHEICMPVPNEQMRRQILKALTRKMHCSDDVDFQKLARVTSGFVGADLKSLTSAAHASSLKDYRLALRSEGIAEEEQMQTEEDDSETHIRQFRALIKRVRQADSRPDPPGFDRIVVSMKSFLDVLPNIQPSSRREGFATVPDTTWDEVGALDDAKKQLQDMIVHPIQEPEAFKRIGVTSPSGLLLWGPPGCGKTLIAKACANESKANFISIKGPELLNKYVGESERAVRQVFTRARSSVPCILFFDELDALTPKRDASSSEATARVVNTLLTELDGVGEARDGIFVIAATNRLEIIDSAMLRPGRLDAQVYIGLPDAVGRGQILATLLKKYAFDAGYVHRLGAELVGLSGADLAGLVKAAQMNAVQRKGEALEVQDLEAAKRVAKASVKETVMGEALLQC